MSKETPLTRGMIALLAMAGLLVFVAAVSATYWSLVHWQVHN